MADMLGEGHKGNQLKNKQLLCSSGRFRDAQMFDGCAQPR
jgi:hypothetical protein